MVLNDISHSVYLNETLGTASVNIYMNYLTKLLNDLIFKTTLLGLLQLGYQEKC